MAPKSLRDDRTSMMKKIRLSLCMCCLALLVSSMAYAQEKPADKPGPWSRMIDERGHNVNGHVRIVRAGSQRTFDRLVFEFSGAVPNYRIEYLTSRVYETEAGAERIKIAGRAFMRIDLWQVPADEEQIAFLDARGFLPKGRLKLPSLRQIEDMGVSEGHYEFLVGLTAKKLFRVTELSNPGRLVIDFKH